MNPIESDIEAIVWTLLEVAIVAATAFGPIKRPIGFWAYWWANIRARIG